MHTQISPAYQHTEAGRLAESILRRCVHCGFCTATCPTFQVTGDELDSPRGRIYQIKQIFEGMPANEAVQTHLDRCLTCRNCETTCPSGVQYGRLLDLGRAEVQRQIGRKPWQRWQRGLLRRLLTRPALFGRAYRLAQHRRDWLPPLWRAKVLPRQTVAAAAPQPAARRVLLPAGCVQPAMLPGIGPATVRLLNAVGIEAILPASDGCCGAVDLHLDAHEAALAQMRRNIDVWWPHIEAGAEAIVSNASACGLMLKDYGFQLRHDPAYAAKAERVSALCRDVVEILAAEAERLRAQLGPAPAHTVAYHPPCTLQHGQKLGGRVEALLADLGLAVALPAEAHLCCGSAGSYALLQPALSQAVTARKQTHLAALQPEVVLSANVGCIAHLSHGSAVPVRHWVEYVADWLVAAQAGCGAPV